MIVKLGKWKNVDYCTQIESKNVNFLFYFKEITVV